MVLIWVSESSVPPVTVMSSRVKLVSGVLPKLKWTVDWGVAARYWVALVVMLSVGSAVSTGIVSALMALLALPARSWNGLKASVASP